MIDTGLSKAEQVYQFGVLAVERTANKKTGPVSVTMVSQVACDSKCPFLAEGCYAEEGRQGMWTRLVNASPEVDLIQLARNEATAIDTLTGKLPMRLKVVGDSTTVKAVKIVQRAVKRFRAKFASPVWSYTHAWHRFSRKHWQDTSILASCETIAQCHDAIARGWAPALVVDRFGTDKATVVDGLRLIPCPAQTREGIQCVDCRLCWDDKALHARKAAILFAAHGSGAKKIRRALAAA